MALKPGETCPPGYKLTEVGVIPEEWGCRTLQDLTDSARPIGYGIVQTGKAVLNGVKCIRVVDMIGGCIEPEQLITTSDEISQAYKRTLLRANDLVIALRGKIGAVAVINEELAGSNLTRGVALLSASDKFHSGYLAQYLSSSYGKNSIEKNLNGSALQEIPIAALRRLPVVVPPIPEQRAIAAALSDVDALLAKLDQLIAKKRDLKQAAMQQLLTGQTRLPGFSGEWEVKRFSELFQFLGTANNPRADLSEFGEIGYIHYGDIHTASAAFLDCAQTGLPQIAQERVPGIPLIENGDLVMADASEDYEGIGKCIEVRNVQGRHIVAGLHTFLLRGNKAFLANGFKGYLQFFPAVKSALIRFATGISVYGVSKTNVKSIEILLPKTDEQTAIATVLADMDAEIAALETRRDKTRALKQGMMQALLTGRIRLL